MTQRTFLDDECDQSWGPTYNALPLARTTDPVTSHLAVPDTNTLGHLKQAALCSARELCATHGDCTANEIAAHAANGVIGVESVRKRVNELRRAGLLTEAVIRTCRVSGKQAQAYRVS